MTKNWSIGQSTPKIDGRAKSTGDLLYVEDMVLPGMLYGKILRSPHAYAKIKRIQTEKAARLPGVRSVITAEDTPKIKFSFIEDQSDNLPLCDHIVRYIGDEVAAVACDTPEIAEKALDLIDVEYEELPAVFDPSKAMEESQPLIHDDRPKNISYKHHTSYGDIQKAFNEADYIYEDYFNTSKQVHCCLERRACIAQFDQSNRLTLWSQTQTPHTLRKELAKVLDIRASNVRVIRMPIGGGFGNRLVMDMKEPIAALLSKKTRKPVLIANTRDEEFTTARTRYPYSIKLKTAVKKNGKVIGRHAEVLVDNGAYSDKGSSTMKIAENVHSILYSVPNTKFDGYIVYTNKQYGTGFRGFGNPQITYAIESQMDMIADRLNMDPVELRKKNATKRGDIASNGKAIDTDSMLETLEKTIVRSDWHNKREIYSKQSSDLKKIRGIGAACMVQSGGGSRGYGYNSTDAFVKLSEEGQVTIITPAVEMGQGPQTVMAQTAGEVLGVSLDDIKIIDNDTDIIPYDLGSWGSRTTYVNGLAVKDAAEQAKAELMELASLMYKVHVDKLVLKGGMIGPVNDWGQAVSIAEITRYAASKEGRVISGKGRFYDPEAPKFVRGEDSDNIPVLVYGCQIAEVEVDIETGQVKVLKVVAAHDCGKAINPKGVEGQVEGGIVQGVGYALTEGAIEIEGNNLNANFLDYKILSSPDIPDMEVIIVEDLDNAGPFSAKGVGEQGIIPTAAAVGNAIYQAVGVRINDLPFTPEKILKGLGKL